MARRVMASAGRRAVAAVSAAGILLSSIIGPLSPAYGQVITDPKAPIQFRPGITSSGNGTPTVNIVKPSKGGVSHNQFREYNIDTRGLILNNSGLGGTSIIGGQVAKNPNLAPGGEARIILNEVTGTNRSQLNGVTEVFGKKADVIVANPNGIGCVGCGFINTGTATLSTGVPIVDYEAGKVGFETHKGDITISGAGVSAPAGQLPDRVNLIGRSLDIGGKVDAKSRVSLTAGATRIDPASGVASRLTDAEPAQAGQGIVSSSAGVIRAASIDVLSSDINAGVVLAGNLQALGSYDSAGKFVPGDLSLVSAGDLDLVAGEASGEARVAAGGRFQLARDLSAAGEIAITAQDVSLLDSGGVHAGRDLKIVAQADIVSGAVLKSGGALSAKAGGDASLSGLIAGHDGLELEAGAKLSTNKATLIAPEIGVEAPSVDLTSTWVVPGKTATIAGVDVTLGRDTAFDPKGSVDVAASERLTLGTLIDVQDYPALSLAFCDLAISETGVFVSDNHAIDAGTIDNAGKLVARGDMALNANRISNAATGEIKAEAIEIRTAGGLTNLGQILSSSTLAVLADGAVRNDGVIGTDGVLKLEALSYAANSPSAELAASRVSLVLDSDLINKGTIISTGALGVAAGGQLANSGAIRAGGTLELTVGDLINSGTHAVVDGRAAVTITAAGSIDNLLGSIYATNSLDLAAGGALGNSGLIYGEAGASLRAAALSNHATGRLHAGTVFVDLKGGDITNLGEIVSKTTLDVIHAGDVLNDGIVQAGGALRLETLSYTANSAEAELVAAKADLILDGGLKNAGLIAAAERLGLEVGGDASTGATSEIAARTLEARIVGDLTNLGSLVSEQTLATTVGGLLTNQGAVRAGGALELNIAELVNSGAGAVIDGRAAVTIASSGRVENLSGSIYASADLDMSADGQLTNSGLIYSGAGANLLAAGFDNNRAGGATTAGQLYAETVFVDLKGGDLTNLGQIVSKGTLDVVRAGDVVNNGIVQASGALSLAALSYAANSAEAELVAAQADLILQGGLTNAGLIATAERLGLEVDGDLSNTASGEIAAKGLEARIAGDLTNLGQLVSEQTLQATVGGLLTNQGAIRTGGALNLTVADLVNSGAAALIAGNGGVTITASKAIDNRSGRIAAGADLTLTAGTTVANSGLMEAQDLAITARTLDNQASGKLYAGSVSRNASGVIATGTLAVKLSGNLSNLGEIVSANSLDITSGGNVANDGSIEAGGTLRLEARAYQPDSAAARLAATNLDLILGTSLTNSGTLSVAGRLGLDIDGDLTNTATGRIEAGAIEADIGGNLTNLGAIVSANTLRAVVGGLLTNEGSIRSGTGMILQAAGLINRGEAARIETGGDLLIKTAGNLDNYLGQIRAVGNLGLEAGGVLTNASGRIESGRDMQIVAATLLNTAVAGTDGGAEDFYKLGELTVDYSYDEDDHVFSTDHETFINAELHEFSGQIDLDRPGVIRAGRDMMLTTDTLTNENGRILAVNDLSIETRILTNDAQTYTVDHFVNTWGRKYSDDWVPFTPPSGSNVPWGVYKWNNDAINQEYYASLINQLPKKQVTKTRLVFAGTRPSFGTTYHANGPDGPGWYTTETYRVEEIQFGTRTETRTRERGGDTGGTVTYTVEVPDTHPREWFDTAEGKAAFLNSLNLLIARGESPVSVGGSDDVSQSKAEDIADIRLLENVDASQLLDLAKLGIDPNDVPDVIVVTNRDADPLGEGDYRFEGRERVGDATVARGSVIKAGNTLSLDSDRTTNRGTLAGSLVAIEGGTLDNGIGAIGGVDGSGFGQVDRAGLGTVAGGSGSGLGGLDPTRDAFTGADGSNLGLAGGSGGIVDFVIDDVAVPPLDLGQLDTRNLVSLDPNDFGNLQKFTGSLEAARLLAGAHLIDGAKLSFYADPVAEAKALADAALRQAGSHLVIDPNLSAEEQREQLYRNAAEFAELTGAKYGVALTEAQRAALTKPIVWHETRIVDGKPVLVPRLYLPSSDELLRGARGPGLIAADDLILDLGDRLNNTGAIAIKGLASISASSIINQRLADLDMRDRAFAGGRGDTGLITAGTLLMVTDADLANRGGTISSAGTLDLRIGGDLVNETQRYTRAVDSFDLCLGNACGADAVDYNVARITAGRDLTIVAGRDIINKGGELGAVTDMLLAAGRNVEFETLKDSYLTKDYHQRGFLSGKDIVEHSIVTADATAQSLVGDVSIFAGYGVCDGGNLCAKGKAPGDAILNGALISAYGNTTINATGEIAMGAVSEEVQNTFKEWGFKGLGWGSVKQKWNDIDTSVTRISGNDVLLTAKGPITGTGVQISAVNDLLMKTDDTIKLEAAQDALYFTEKGFYIGLTFPGSAGIDAALRGGSGSEVLTGLAGVSPLTAKLAALANADNGLAAGLAVVNLATGGLAAFYDGGQTVKGPNLGSPLGAALDPLASFRDPKTGEVTAQSVASTLGITISSWKKQQNWTESQVSQLTAGGDIVMQAGLDVILSEGTKLVSGGDVSIDAGRDILMSALLDYAKDKSSSWGLQLSFTSIGFDIAKSKGYDEQLTNASITAAGDVSLKSGRDTALLGGNITGQNVSLDVGRDLTILSPQARGWRDGFSFGLTIGLDLTSFGIRGSSEDGEKTWSSPSGIVAAEDISIKVGEDTTLVGALINATDGDIKIDTGTLVSADLKDIDKYKNVGGSIGFENGGLDTLGFSYEEKDKRGETRTTLDAGGKLEVVIHDADKDGIPDTPADKAAAEQLLAAINKDASKYQEILKDSHIKLSGELDVGDLRNLRRNLQFLQQYNQAQDAAVPAWVAAEGPQAVDQYREAIIYGGATAAEAEEMMKTPRFQALLKERQSYDALKDGPVSNDDLLKSILLIQNGEELYRDAATGELMVRTACGTNGPCGVKISEVRPLATEDVASFIDQKLAQGGDKALQEALECALAYALIRGDLSHFETLKASGKYNTSSIQGYAAAAKRIVNSALANESYVLADDGVDITMTLTKIVMASQNGQIDNAQFDKLVDILKTDGPTGDAASFRIAAALSSLEGVESQYLQARFERAVSDFLQNAEAEREMKEFIAANPDSDQAREYQELIAQGVGVSMAMAAIGVKFYKPGIGHNSGALPSGTTAFAKWFNDLTPAEFARHWDDPKSQAFIKRMLREPTGFHEWFMVSRADKMKNVLGLSAEDIWSFRTKTDNLTWINPVTGLPGRHGGHGSTTFHNELGAILDSSGTIGEVNSRLISLGHRWSIPNIPTIIRR